MFRAGRLFSKNKVSKLVLAAVLVPGRPPGAILEPPGSILGAMLAHFYSFFDVFQGCFGLRFSMRFLAGFFFVFLHCSSSFSLWPQTADTRQTL